MIRKQEGFPEDFSRQDRVDEYHIRCPIHWVSKQYNITHSSAILPYVGSKWLCNDMELFEISIHNDQDYFFATDLIVCLSLELGELHPGERQDVPLA